MTINLPGDLVRPVLAEVDGGRFDSPDDLVAEAVRSFLGDRRASPADETAFDVIRRAGLIGRVDGPTDGPTDLATNPIHREGFGRGEASGR